MKVELANGPRSRGEAAAELRHERALVVNSESGGWAARRIGRPLCPQSEAGVSHEYLRPLNLQSLSRIRGLEAPRFGLHTDRPAAMTGEQLFEVVGPLLKAFCLEHPYDTVGASESFLDGLDRIRRVKPATTAAEAFAENTWIDDSHFLSCVGFSRAIAAQLRGRGLPAAVGGAELPALYAHPVGHAFAYVPFQNPADASERGVVMVDPYSGVPEIIWANRIGYSERRKGNLLMARDEASFRIVSGEGPPNRWHLRPWLNPEASLLRTTAARTKARLRTFDANGALSTWLTLSMDTREVAVGRAGAGEQKLSFDDREGLRRLLSDDALATSLGIPRTDAESPGHALWRRVSRVIDREADFREVRGVYAEAFAAPTSGRPGPQ